MNGFFFNPNLPKPMPRSNYFIPLSLVLFSTTWAQFTDVINSNRPGKSMAAFSVGKTIIQTEMGIENARETNSKADYEANSLSGDLVLRYGAILEQLEFYGSLTYKKDR